MPSVPTTPPPDDSGADAFRRFGYQARVIFPQCLRLYFVGDIAAIYCEHWEDVLLEFQDRLRFVQIKTRDGARGPWRYGHLLGDSGALRSLLRTHRALKEVGERRPASYDIWLEGPIDSGDRIARLVLGGDGADARMCEICAERLRIETAEAAELLERVAVTPNQPPRAHIDAQNRDLLRQQAGHLTADALAAVYEAVVALARRAMEADILDADWPAAIVTPERVGEIGERLAAAKRLDSERLQPLLAPLEGGGHRLLAEITEPDRLRATALERKLTVAGASTTLIGRAKQFRAMAAIRVAELRGSSLYAVDDMLVDLQLRLINAAESVGDALGAHESAPQLWDRLEERLSANPAAYDPRRILGQDPLLLLGQVCQLSDECRFRWGVHD